MRETERLEGLACDLDEREHVATIWFYIPIPAEIRSHL
jgi:hypothetical protein